jgi:hypothetical protein
MVNKKTKSNKTETSLAAVHARRGKRNPKISYLFVCRLCEDYWDPSWLVNKEVGVKEDRTSGLGSAERKEHYLTAAPFHRFDVRMAD